LKRLGDATMMLEKSQSDGSRPIEALKKSAFKKEYFRSSGVRVWFALYVRKSSVRRRTWGNRLILTSDVSVRGEWEKEEPSL
jgi:hypothetical protein